MIKIYGSPRSSAGRCYWMLEELDLSYSRVSLDMSAKEHKSPEFLALNPNGKIPCLEDNGYVIWESMAINQYLADKYQSPLAGESPEVRGKIAQWSYWSILDLQKPLIDLFIQKVFVPEERRSLDVMEKAEKALPALFSLLEQHLDNRRFLVTDNFGLADLNVASVIDVATRLELDLSSYPNLRLWHGKCHDRPAYEKYSELE